MGVLFCCVFFVKCRQRKPQKLGAKALGPSKSGGFAADCWHTHSLSVVTALCVSLPSLGPVELERRPSEQLRPRSASEAWGSRLC